LTQQLPFCSHRSVAFLFTFLQQKQLMPDQNLPEKFSDDPEENLRIENEILKLKMQAESGAYFGGNAKDLP
jgi:predicted Ser/Thr protein kinase